MEISWSGHVARIGYMRKTYKFMVGILEGKRPFRRTRRRWENVVKVDFK
jgi:hypothetical protein